MNSNLDHATPITSWTSRLYESEQDLRQLQNFLMEARSKTNDWRYWHVGEFQFGFFMVACHLNPKEYIRLWHDTQGKLIAYAMLGEDPSFDWQVLPEYEWRGIETEALMWLETLLSEQRKRDASRWSGTIGTGARQDNAQRIAFLEQQGFQRGGYDEVNMMRVLEDVIPEYTLPAGFQVRSMAEMTNVSDRAAVEREVWDPWTVGNISDEDYAYFMRLPAYHPDLDVVTVTADGTIAASVNGWIDPVNKIGDLGPVSARSAYRRQGLTRAASLESMRRMRAYGMNRVCVSTGETNVAALRLYESLGFKAVNKYLAYGKKQ